MEFLIFRDKIVQNLPPLLRRYAEPRSQLSGRLILCTLVGSVHKCTHRSDVGYVSITQQLERAERFSRPGRRKLKCVLAVLTSSRPKHFA